MTGLSLARTKDGGSLRLWLLSLVMVPIVGIGAAAALEIASHVSTVRSDQKVERIVQATIDINRVRADLQLEILPALTGSLVANPQLRTALGLTAAQTQQLAATIAQVPKLRQATDAAVATLARRSDVDGLGTRTQAQVKQLRATIDSGTYPHTAFEAGIEILDTLSTAQNDQTAAAIRIGLDPASNRALIDLAMVTRAVQFAGEQTPFFIGAQFPGVVSPETTAQTLWVQSWGSYQAWSSAILEQTSAATRAVWTKVISNPAVKSVDDIWDQTTGKPTFVGTLPSLKVVLSDAQRNAVLSGAQDYSVNLVLDSARAQQTAATRALAIIVGLCLLVIGASLAAARWAQRGLSKPLGRLARQATEVSQGELIDVAISGPHEVRTVARGLSESVNSLRTIQAQAAAVAAGDLDSRVVATPVPGALGAVVHASVSRIVGAIRDREQAQNALAHRASHDALTELPNRGEALALIDAALHRAERTGSQTALMFVDLDHFKAVNDKLGHAAGDAVLQTMSRRMKELMRAGDTVARLGGDEFIILLESVTDEGGCHRLAERVVAAAAEPIIVGQREARIGASVGVAFCRDGSVDASRLLLEADAAVYRAKSSGRGQIAVFDEDLRSELADRIGLEQALATALARDEFVLHYQPLVDLNNGSIIGVEALIRWDRPGVGLVAPDAFIPTAEGSALIDDIGQWVLRAATSQLAEWSQANPALHDLTMSVNISGRHLCSPQLPEEVASILATSGVAARRLIIEITETVLVDSPIAKHNMKRLQELGVLIALDDFGTGHTSIGQLPSLPVDILKIDRSFVASHEPGNEDLLHLMVAAAHAFDLTVVAEGIEYEHQAHSLRGAQVETGQGYLFARPCSASEVLQYLSSNPPRSAVGTSTHLPRHAARPTMQSFPATVVGDVSSLDSAGSGRHGETSRAG
ncbi:diguanylate cyclase (GGDEF) domain-containing protein [Frankineae bacterium MT45]|nr:diguanylate cyclase (GGDEF) domain-containing protein [Frankineae bacterium MT45]